VSSSGAGNPAPRLWQVTKEPVAGFAFAASSTEVFFVERASGNVYKADPKTSTLARMTNTLMPQTYEALVAPDGSALLRSLADGSITTFSGSIARSTSSPAELVGTYLPRDIESVAIAPYKKILYLVRGPDGSSVAATADWQGGNRKAVFASALSGWRLHFLADGRMFVSQKASDGIPGHAFEITGGMPQEIARGEGLTVLPRATSTALLYSTSGSGGVSLFAKPSATASPIRLSVETVTEKCVWAPGDALIAYCGVPQTEPDDDFLRGWYRGALHLKDAWWTIDALKGVAQRLYTPESEYALDVRDPGVSEDGTYLAFVNALDQTLWMLRINP